MNIGLRIAAESAHRDRNTTLGPQSACISPCHQLNNIYAALGAFWLCLPRSSLAALQSCSFLFFLGGEPKCHTLCGWEVPAERAGPSSLLTAYRPDSFSYILVPSLRPQDQEKCSLSRELPASQMQNLFSFSPDTSMQIWFNSFIYV